MCVIVHCWVQPAHLLRSLAFQIKDNVNDPVWLFVLQFVLQFLRILRGAFGLKQPLLWSWLHCLTGWEMKIYLHICEALWLLSHTGCLSFLPAHSRQHTDWREITHFKFLFKRKFICIKILLCINPPSFQCYTQSQYKIVTQLILCLFGLFYLFRLKPHISPKLPLHLHFLPGPSAGSPSSDLSHSEPHEWTIVPFSGAPWP